ncbi:hypothetical protein GCM10022224_102450 [Nonomuraea antimicrobica]|uniref:WXG100 family type VII secretion target n=1 Tax=Nonomuraea antimicrobica TaxID=561173 RepID=A0ABP7EKW0_9ACTN
MPDRLSECQADMRLIAQATDDIERTLKAVDATCDRTIWAGPAGDRFREEWAIHRKAIQATLDDLMAQTQTIAARVRREQQQQ